MSSWYKDSGNQDDIILSTRVRLARNIEALPFPSAMTPAMQKQLNETVKDAILNSDTPFAKQLKFIAMDNVPENEVYAMVERHMISREFAENFAGKAVIISEDETVCVMIGEEDHIRIQVIKSGLQLEEAYSIANSIDDILSAKLKYAFDSELGYLTNCPTNLGTGLRASVMMHLPMINESDMAEQIKEIIAKMGFTVRGMYGEGSKSQADLYQVSNQITLGITEKDALKNLDLIACQIAEKEREIRNSKEKIKLEDAVYRAYGILKNQRIISSSEMMRLVSKIKMGVAMGILDIDKTIPVRILIETQPFMIAKTFGEKTPEERDIIRGGLIREYFKE